MLSMITALSGVRGKGDKVGKWVDPDFRIRYATLPSRGMIKVKENSRVERHPCRDYSPPASGTMRSKLARL
jgi:hypothetical protein